MCIQTIEYNELLTQYGFSREIFDQIIDFLKQQMRAIWVRSEWENRIKEYDQQSDCNCINCMILCRTCCIPVCLSHKYRHLDYKRLDELQSRFLSFAENLQKNMTRVQSLNDQAGYMETCA